MEMSSKEELIKLLKDGAEKFNVQLTEHHISQLFMYKDLLLEWNEKMNLTAITDETEIMIKHYLDSFSIVPLMTIESGKNYKAIDVGTGAGFPGIPIKIAYPEINMTLMDSLNKRVSFLNEVCSQLSLTNTRFIHMRAEEGGKSLEHRDKYDFCFSRAVAKLSILTEYCLPYVKMGGYFIAMKGSEINDELNEANAAINKLGGEIVDVKTVMLPINDIKHTNIVVKKVRQTPQNYPRIAAQILKNPIK